MFIIVVVIVLLYMSVRVAQKIISPQHMLSIYFGVPGVGKSTMAAYLTKRDLKRKKKVWSNVPIAGTLKLVPEEDIGVFNIEKGRVIIDEAGIEYDNRNYKSFSKNATYFYKFHRHFKTNIDIFSQGYDDMDKKLRTLAQQLFLMQPSFIPFFISRTRIRKRIGVNELSKDICDEYYLSRLEFKLIFSPPLWKMFRSYDHVVLPEKKWETWS